MKRIGLVIVTTVVVMTLNIVLNYLYQVSFILNQKMLSKKSLEDHKAQWETVRKYEMGEM